jgi:uncharacterized protein (DUF58 family)
MKLVRTLYLKDRMFMIVGLLVIAFTATFIDERIPIVIPKAIFFLFVALIFTDLLLLYRTRIGIRGNRHTPEKLSNGDDNELKINLQNLYPFNVRTRIIDEVPHQFQRRDVSFYTDIKPGETKTIKYTLRPVKRGEYSFGSLNVFASSPLALLARRFSFSNDKVVPVYPSYLQMRKYELMAISNRLTESGIKKIRRIGHNMEFELIKEYVSGDDYRTVNWKATARKNHLMVNHYQDERSQQVYSLIDKGRVMQMPFEGLTLLDYAINAALVISNIAIRKSDKAGLLTFQDKIGTMLPAGKTTNQMMRIQEVLYNQKTAFRETDFSALYNFVRRKITQRSLLLLYTNFESIHSMHRQLPFLVSLARQHLVVVIFFENTELHTLIERPAHDLRRIYHKAVAEKLVYERKLIVRELKKSGVHALLTTPQHLTVNTINKYLELKARGLI